jgi:hypothetical protein
MISDRDICVTMIAFWIFCREPKYLKEGLTNFFAGGKYSSPLS